MKKLSKKEAQKEIEEFFSDIKNKSPKEIKKIKSLAMTQNIKLGEKRKLFCKECMTPYKFPKIRINNLYRVIECEKCGYVARYKISEKKN
jgi:RNase P subunit RPR2